MPQPRATPGSAPPQQSARVAPQRLPDTAGATIAASAGVVAGIYGYEAEAMVGGAALQARVAAGLTKAQAQAIIRAALLGLRRLSIQRRAALPRYFAELYVRVRPGATAAEVREATRRELSREMAFRTRQLARVRQRMTKAFAEPTPAKRGKRVAAVISQERHYALLREEAVAARAAGAADAQNVLDTSPEGAVWKLGHRRHHCPGCAFLHGKAFPWEALRAASMIPPLGPGCGCSLRGVREAWLMGEVPELLAVPSVLDALPILATARELGHSHNHDGGITLAG